MKRALAILFLIINYSCKKDNNIKLTEITNDTVFEEVTKSKSIDSLGIQTGFNIEYIKSKTSNLSDKIRVSYNPNNKNKNSIPKEFLTNFIKPHKIDIGYPEYLPDDYPQSYSFKEFKEYPEFDLFTFTHDDESCCTTLYAVTTKKGTLEVINIGVIGYTGGDGGWVGEKYGDWTNEYLIKSIEPSEYEEPAPEKPIEKEIDTIWSEIKILKSGKMEYSEIKKVKYLGTKKIK
jgi:hypothetical protein